MRGEGVYLYDSAGKQYLDGSGGAAVSCLGHGHPVVIEAIKAQLDKLVYAHTAFFTNEPQERLAEQLAGRFGDDGARVYFLSGGSEANETAIKIARQYWLASGHDKKHVVISRSQSYHGNTLGALSASGNLGRRKIFAPLLHDWPKTEPCYEYRHRQPDESPEQYGERAAKTLEETILAAGPDNVSAFLAETVVGATLGAVPPVPGYFRAIREICDRYDVLLMLDEVMAGCGRSGTYFAFEQDDVQPDIVTVAKGLGGGYQAVGATIVQQHVHDAIVERFGAFEHGHTYIGHATSCATALAVASVIDNEKLLDNVQFISNRLLDGLGTALAEHPNVGDIRGRGLLLGIELVTVFADIEHDITDRFLLQYAARYENFSDFGSTLNGKLAARFRINDGFALRGAVSTGFHAPTPGQTNISNIITTFDSGIQVEEGLVPSTSPLAAAVGGAALTEENAVNISAGFTADFGDAWTLTADVYQIEVSDRIYRTGSIPVPALPTDPPNAPPRAISFFTNVLDVEHQGLDIVLDGGFDIGSTSQLDLTFVYSYNQIDVTDQKSVNDVQPVGDDKVEDIENNYPESRFVLTGNFLIGESFNILARANYYGDHYDENGRIGAAVSPSAKIGSIVYLDLEAGWNLNDNWRLVLGAVNVTDEFIDEIGPPNANALSSGLQYTRRSVANYEGGSYYLRANYNW